MAGTLDQLRQGAEELRKDYSAEMVHRFSPPVGSTLQYEAMRWLDDFLDHPEDKPSLGQLKPEQLTFLFEVIHALPSSIDEYVNRIIQQMYEEATSDISPSVALKIEKALKTGKFKGITPKYKTLIKSATSRVGLSERSVHAPKTTLGRIPGHPSDEAQTAFLDGAGSYAEVARYQEEH